MSVQNDRIPGSRSPTDIDRVVGANVRRLRTEQGKTLQDLSEELRISHQQLQKYETGHNRLSAGMLPVLADALGCCLEELFASSDAPVTPVKTRLDRLRSDCQAFILREKSEEKLLAMSRVLKALSS